MKILISISVVLLMLPIRIGVAQNAAIIKGTLLAPGGAVIPNARLIIQNEQFKTEVTMDERGRFEVSVPAGNYRLVTVKVRGFAVYKRKLRVRVGETVSVDIVPKLVLAEFDCVLQVTDHF